MVTGAAPVILRVGTPYAGIKFPTGARHGGKRAGSGAKRRDRWGWALSSARERPCLGTVVKGSTVDVEGPSGCTLTVQAPRMGAPWGSDAPTAPCTRTGRVHTWQCGACGHPHWSPDPCSRLDCARCARKGGRVAKRRAKKLVRRLGGVPWGIWTVTLPRAWQDRLTFAALEEFARSLRAALQECYRYWFGASIGLREYWHPEGDERPGHPQWHWNAIVPLRGLDSSGATVDLRFALQQWQLGEFRDRVRDILAGMARALGEAPPETAQGDGDEPPEDGAQPAAVVWYGFRIEKGRKLHAARYFGRPFAWWGVALGRLHHGRDYGLLSIGAFRKLGEDAWRAFRESLRSERDEDGGLACLSCGGPLLHQSMRVASDDWTRDYMVAASNAGGPP